MKHSVIKALEEALLSYLSDMPHIALSYNEIVSALQLNKLQKKALGELLTVLVGRGVLIKDKRKYALLSPTPEKKPRTTFRDLAQPQPGRKQVRVEQPENQDIKNPRLIEGIFDATPLSRNFSYAFVRTPDRDYYIGAEDTLNAYHNDVVALEPKFQKGKQDYGIIRKIVKRASEQLAGDVIKVGKRWTFVCSNPKIHNWFEVSEVGEAKEGEKVILTVTNWGSPLQGKLPVGKVTEVLGKSGDPQVELLAVIRQYGLPLEFPEDVMQAANALKAELTQDDYLSRRDLRGIFTFTIDPVSAKDFDDAISLEKRENGWKLYVHIADVASYLPVEGIIFQEAAKRGNSFYFPKKVIPMIPERLSNLICSLRPGEEKLCLTVETEFNFKGKILSQHICESVIKSDFRLAYEEVDDLFEGQNKDFDSKLAEVLMEARQLSRLLTEKRNAAGYIYFDLPEIEYQYDENGFVKRLNLAEETESHKLIENFMLVANEYVAQRLSQLSPTTIYRIHEDPDFNKLQKLIDLLSHYGVPWVMHENLNKSLQYLLASFPKPEYHEVFDRITLRSMKKARYSTEHISHFGLALKDYTHFTSPIRRLCDLVIHHLCKIYLIKSSHQKLFQSQIKLYAEVASEQELQADQAERDIDRVYSRAYMREKIGEVFSGMVISTSGSGVIVRLKEIPVTGVIKTVNLGEGQWYHFDREMRYVNKRNGYFYQLMDTLKVEISSIEDDIYLVPSGDKQAHQHVYQPQLNQVAKPKHNGVDFTPRQKKYAPKPAQKAVRRGKRR
jgi:ribonuclease R